MSTVNTTVLLAAPRSFCAGVERAIEIVELVRAQTDGPVYVRKQIVHNAHVVADLAARGAVFVDELDEVPDGATVVFSAHGVSPAVRTEADRRGLSVVDATCPLVTKVHAEARRFAARGDTVILVGHAGHEEVEGTLGEAPGATVLVQDAAEAARVRVPDPDRVSYLTQTTLATDETAEVRVYFTARALPDPQRAELMTLARDYAATVVRQEWPLMAGGHTSGQARAQVAAMRVTTHELRPATADQEILMGDTLDSINGLVDARRERTSALTAPVSAAMWLGLGAGSVLTVGFTFLLNRPRYGLHLLMVGAMAALIAAALWLVHDLSQPYAGTSAVGPDAFEQILQRFREFPPDL